ncbi:hypothetical protein KCP78_15870 [Salmonella enterica subsp. enterica]|nr:hypothetical protein KCP78_15870 [Salmonella enterica subsp. enterica]
MSETLMTLATAGVNPDLVYQAIRGLAGSTVVLDAKRRWSWTETFKRFPYRLHIESGENARWIPPRRWRAAPADRAVMEMMQRALRGWTRRPWRALACATAKNWRSGSHSR